MSRNLDDVKTFFDPHPGFAGAAIPMPTAVKKVADELDGKRMSLREAVVKIQAVASGTVSVKDGWIALELHDDSSRYMRHLFRVICFR